MSIIQSFLDKNPNLIVVKPGCPFCQNAIEMLDSNRIPYKKIDHKEERELVEAIKHEKNHTTFPMIFINSKFIGGFQQLKEQYERR